MIGFAGVLVATTSTELNAQLADIALADIAVPEEFRKLSGFLPMIVFVPRPAVRDGTGEKDSPLDMSVPDPNNTTVVSSSMDAVKAWFKRPGAGDAFQFGEVTVCFSTMEIHR